jgi:hypothetical protein
MIRKKLLLNIWILFILHVPVTAFGQFMVPGVGAEAQGAGVAVTGLDQDPRPELIMMGYYNPPQDNVFRYKVGWNIDGNGNAAEWGHFIEVQGAGWEAQGAGVAVQNFDSDPRPEMVLMANDNPPGPNSFRYKIGWNLSHAGEASHWSELTIVPGVGNEASGAAISFANFDANPRPEMILMAYDNPPQANTFRYRVGWNIDEAGKAVSWSELVIVPGVGWEAQGTGVALSNLDADMRPDMVLMAYDNPRGPNTFRYKIGWNLNASGVAERWGEVKQEQGLGWEAQGAAAEFVAVDGKLKLIFMAYDNPAGENTFRYKLIPFGDAPRMAVMTGEMEILDERDRDATERQAPVREAGSISVRIPEVMMGKLEGAGIRNGEELVARMQNRTAVEELSHRTGMQPERLVAAARQVEMERVLQPVGIGSDYLKLLAFLDLDKPQDLVSFRGREEQLYQAMVDVAGRSGVAPPTHSEVTEWVQVASSAQVKLPDSRTLIPERTREAAEMKPSRRLSIAYWNPNVVTLPLEASEAIKTATLLPMLLDDKTAPFTLKQGQKSLLKDFTAGQAGLYRADISFARKGGHVTLQWRIEKSTGAPVVQGGEALTLEDIIKGKSAYYVYFWLTGQDIADGKPMKFHIEVSRNEDYKVPPKPKDTIEQMGGDPPAADPTITGTLTVTRQMPTAIDQIGQADVPFLNKPDPNKINYPIQYVEMPDYKPASRPTGIEYPLKMTMIPDPNTFREPYVEHGTTKADPGLVWNELQVMCSDNVITNGKTTTIKGITHYELNNPPAGVYRVLVTSPAVKLQKLIQTGIAWNRETGILPVKRVIVRAHLDGGNVPLAYVAELWRLEVSDQAEHGSDDNDGGLGEFKLEANTLLARMPADKSEQKQLDQQPKSWLQKHPIEATRSVFPQDKHIHIPYQGGAFVCYPGRLLSWWTEDDDDSANQLLTVFTSIIEDDDLTWWQKYGEMFTFLVKTVVALFKAAYAGDISGIANVFKDAVMEGKKLSGLPVQAVDDVTGYTIFSSTRNQGFGLLRPGEKGYGIVREFSAEGNGEAELIDTANWPPPAPGAHIPATVSKKVNSGKRWANTGISIRKAFAFYTRRLRVQIQEIQLSYDFSISRAKGDDNTWWWPLKVYSTVGDGILKAVDVELKGNKPQIVKCNWKPAVISKKPDEWKRAPARYFEVGLWEKSGGEAFAGLVSMTLYPHELIQLATLAKPMPLDQAGKDAYNRGDMEDVKNHSHVIVTKQGPDYVADFTIYDPGYHMEYIKYRVFLEIWYN